MHRSNVLPALTAHIAKGRRGLTKPLALLCGLVCFATLFAPPAQAAQSSLHYMGCYSHNYPGEARISEGWGFHALYWKACLSGKTFNDFNANPPTSFISTFSDEDLDAQEANSAVFPVNPGGSWSDNSVNNKEELLLIAAMYMDRYDSPVYVEVDIDNDGFSQPTVIRAVQYSGQDPSSKCDFWGWSDDEQDPKIVAANCSFFEGPFSVTSVDVAYWDFVTYTQTSVTGSMFPTLCFFETYVADPPDGAAQLFRKDVDHLKEYRETHSNALPPAPCGPSPLK
ncbi:MAG: hypothetical protein K0U98_11240 [Deltaproteobacteria bacterium]|nr:hypothetical protein [Deltaproteobacteria bacterium]